MQIRDNEKMLKALKNRDSLKNNQSEQLFVLDHRYFEEPPLYVEGCYSENTMNAIIAYIQSIGSDIDMNHGMNQGEIIEVLKEFYDCKAVDPAEYPHPDELEHDAEEIELYANWHFWGLPDLDDIPLLRRDGLYDYLKKIIKGIE